MTYHPCYTKNRDKHHIVEDNNQIPICGYGRITFAFWTIKFEAHWVDEDLCFYCRRIWQAEEDEKPYLRSEEFHDLMVRKSRRLSDTEKQIDELKPLSREGLPIWKKG